MAGTAYRWRDKRGWRIPLEGTKSAFIYEMLLAGSKVSAIHQAVGGDYNTVSTLIWMIRNPDRANHHGRMRGRRHSKYPQKYVGREDSWS